MGIGNDLATAKAQSRYGTVFMGLMEWYEWLLLGSKRWSLRSDRAGRFSFLLLTIVVCHQKKKKKDCYDNNGHRKRGCSSKERGMRSISFDREDSE